MKRECIFRQVLTLLNYTFRPCGNYPGAQTMFFYRTAIVFAYVLSTPITASSGAAAKVQIFKCVTESGKLSFQKSPCPANDRGQRMLLVGDSQANRDAADVVAAQTAADSAAQERRDQAAQIQANYSAAQAQAQLNAANAAKTKPPVVCPRIDTDGVKTGRPIEYRDATQTRRFRPSNQALEERGPSKTFLKNAGLWPDECPQ